MLKAKKSKTSAKSTKKTTLILSYFQAGVFKDHSSLKKVKLSHNNNNNGLTTPVTTLNKTSTSSEQANVHDATCVKSDT